MRRTFVMISLLAAAMCSQASELEHSVGIQLGWDREIYRLNQPTVLNDNKSDLKKYPLNGGRIGFVYELAHESGVGLFTALDYAYTWHRSSWEKIPISPEGKISKYEGTMMEYSTYTQSHRLDVEAYFQYKFELATRTYLVLYTGPSFQWIAKYIAQDNFRYNDTEIKKRYYFEESLRYNTEDVAKYYREWNITWGLGAAFQYDIYYIRGGYNFGLVNPYKVDRFGDVKYVDENGQMNDLFKDGENSNYPDQRLTRGRLDSWYVTLGVFIWQSDK